MPPLVAAVALPYLAAAAPPHIAMALPMRQAATDGHPPVRTGMGRWHRPRRPLVAAILDAGHHGLRRRRLHRRPIGDCIGGRLGNHSQHLLQLAQASPTTREALLAACPSLYAAMVLKSESEEPVGGLSAD